MNDNRVKIRTMLNGIIDKKGNRSIVKELDSYIIRYMYANFIPENEEHPNENDSKRYVQHEEEAQDPNDEEEEQHPNFE